MKVSNFFDRNASKTLDWYFMVTLGLIFRFIIIAINIWIDKEYS